MKSIYFGLVLLIWVNSVFAQTTPIPDSNFESFLIAQGIDSNGANGNILNSDAAAVTNLNVTVNNITNFAGLQAFVNLVSLNLGANQFTTVPLSALVDLEEFRFSGNDILDNLDVSNNTKLRVFIARGSGSGSDATILSIDLSNNVLLEDIQVYAFRDLDVVTLPVTNTVENLYLLIFNTFTVDLSGYQNMHTLFLSTNFNNTFPINADLPDFPNVLRNITVQGGNLGLVDIAQQLVLERLRLQSTNVQNINLPVTNTLREIDISGHRISNINFQNASMLERLTITGKSLPGALTINVTQNPNLNYLSAYSNYMTAVNVTQNPLLETLNVYTNELTSLNVSQNPVLETLNARYNLLPGINLTQNPLLESVDLSNNQIPNLNVTQNPELYYLVISKNLFTGTGLDLTNNTKLRYLNASENEIESLDISHTVVEDLILNHNRFTGKEILEQYFDLWDANGGLKYSYTLDVSFNGLTGKIPDFASLIVPNVTRSFELKIDNNIFHFGDFEQEHQAYVNALSTVVNTWYTVFETYTYAPQSLVNAAQTLNQVVGSQVTLTTTVRGTQNHYQWYKDGVAIPSAPDSPDYTFYASPCDQGEYYCIVTSDLVPFVNGNPPGTGGKNLQIQRRNITLNVSGTAPKQCVDLTDPLNNATGVPIDSNITWEVAPGACGYKISLGTNAAANNILANEDLGNTLTYDPTTNLLPNTDYFIRIVPYYTDGDQAGCAIQRFSTGLGGTAPSCTTITSPGNGSTDIALDAAISWTAVSDADGYFVTIGTTSGGNELVDGISVTGTSYTYTSDFAENTTYYVSVVPYNSVGEAIGCSEISFTTETLATVPNCTTITSPGNGATDIALDATITWTAVSDADGYYVTIGTTSGGNELVDAVSVTGTSYTHASDIAENTTYYVTVIPYNSVGEATGCSEISFTTETLATAPNCTTITSPGNGSTDIALDAAISWTAVSDADGYYVTIGTTSGGNELVDAESVTGTSYTYSSDFAENTTYYVSVVPYNSVGEAAGCSEISFTTETLATAPNCTTITSPGNGATDIALDATITWTAVSDADGYYVTIGTTSGGNELVDAVSVTGTSYTHPSDLAENTTYYVSVVPYNSVGEATGCAEISFTTAAANVPIPPACTTITSPGNGSTDIALDATITWTAVSDADGYYVTIGTTSGGNELVDVFSVTGTSYSHTSDFAENTTYYVSVVPYNSVGEAGGCAEISFTTAAANVPIPPACTTITSPGNGANDIALDAAITWTAVLDADDYYVTIGTTSGGNELVDAVSVTGTSYSHTSDFAENTTYFVSVVPYNSVGEADGCAEISFTTAAANVPTPPACTTITSPGNGTTDVALDAAISWTAVSDADGYYLTIGTTSGGNELVDGVSVTGTSYTHTSDFAENTTYYVSVVPYNSVGEAAGCSEISFTTAAANVPTPPACTTITSPGNGSTDVALDAAITWTAVSDADGYYVTIGTTSGGNELVDAISVSGTSYTHPSDFAENTTYYVSVVPYNAVGEATGCVEISFTTAAANVPTPPACTTITFPGNGSTDIALDAAITWTAVSDADGYYVTIGTTSGGNELVDAISVTGTSYTHTSDFAENTTYYVSVVPNNSVGEATGCAEISFTTETLATVPACTTITSPGNGATDVALDATITWTAVSNVDGYYVTIGTTSGGNELVDEILVTGTSYTHSADFAENTTYYVSVVPYNAVGEADGCTEISFTTAAANVPTPPACTTITSPGNGATDIALDATITWTAVSDADGYYVTIGTTAGGNELVDAVSVTGTSYTHTSDFVENTTYYVSVVPYNSVGEADGCTEISFTTETLPTPPDCTLISFPNNQNNGIPVMSIISWQEVENAEGYYVTLTQTSSGEAVLSNQIVFEMSIDLSGLLEYGQEYEISVIPFNGQGEAESCGSSLFTTESLDFNPKTKYGISPNGDGINDFWEIEGIESFPDNRVAVYNRWGDKVFEVKSYDNQLNVFEGRASRLQYLGAGELPEGTYFFEIQILSEEAKGKYRGFLIIKR